MRFFVLFFLTLMLVFTTNVKAVEAGPHLTLAPVSDSGLSVGTNFIVTVGVDSGTEASSAVDAWGTFDASKLEIVSIVVSSTPAFPMELSSNFDNVTGKFQISAASTSSSSYDDKVIKGELAKVTFKPKSAGVASMNFTCQSGSTIDSNIFKSTGVDVIDCASNQSGSYTVAAASGGVTSTPTITPTPTTTTSIASTTTSTTTVTPTVAAELPKTGNIASTLGLVIFGGMSIAGALFLRLL